MPLDVETEDVAGVEADLVGVRSQLHAAGLAATADLHLRLHHDGVPGLLRDGDGLFHRVGHPARRGRDAEAGEVLLALVLVEIHLGSVSFVGVGCVGLSESFVSRPCS